MYISMRNSLPEDIWSIIFPDVYGSMWYDIHRELRVRNAIRRGGKNRVTTTSLYKCICAVFFKDDYILVDEVEDIYEENQHRFPELDDFVYGLTLNQLLFCACGHPNIFPSFRGSLHTQRICCREDTIEYTFVDYE